MAATLLFQASLATGCSQEGETRALASVGASALADISLTDHDGKTWTPSAFEGSWSLLFLGFTRCPNVCPLTLQQTGAARRWLEAREVAPPQVFLLSVDPEHDTPERLRSYLSAFGAGYTGLTGPEAEIGRVARWLDATYHKVERPNAQTGAVEHSAYLYFVDPQGRVRTRFSGVDTARDIGHAMLRIMQPGS